jgi:outer membrane receptor protein involved in Fe transport
MANKTWKASLACGAAAIALATATAAAAQQRTFNIPAESAVDSIPEFARQAGVQITAPDDQLAGVQTPAIRGQRDARQALRELLAGTGLQVISDTGAVIVLHRGEVAATPQAESGAGNAPPELSEVVVTGSHIPGAKAASPLTILDRQTIDDSGYSTMSEMIRSLPQNFGGGQNPGVIGSPGFNQGSISGGSSPNLRGLGPESTLTLIDGHRLTADAFYNTSDISLIPFNAVQRIEVLTDGASAAYGSDAVAGVVNFILRKDFTGAETTARAGGASGGADERDFSQLVGTKWNGGNIIANYEYYKTGGLDAGNREISQGLGSGNSLLPRQERNSFFIDANQQINSTITGFIDGVYSTRTSDTLYNVFGETGSANTATDQYQITAGLEAKLPLEWLATLDGTIARDTNRQHTVDNDNGDLSDTTQRYRNRTTNIEFGASGPLFDLPAGPVRSALGGGRRTEDFGSSTTAGVLNASRSDTFAYGELNIPLVSNLMDVPLVRDLSATASVRYDHYTEFGGTTNPKIGISYSPTSDLRVRATWGTSFRAPSMEAVYGQRVLNVYPGFLLGQPGSQVIILSGSNPALRPETSSSFTVGADYTPRYIPGLRFNLTYFHIDYKNRIVDPVTNLVQSLTNPVYAPFVDYNPSLADQAALLDSASLVQNFSGLPVPSLGVVAVVNDEFQNAASEGVKGIDFSANYRAALPKGEIELAAAGTVLNLHDRLTALSTEQLLSGTIFNPPKFKFRGTAAWRNNGWTVSGALNFIGPESDTVSTPPSKISSWTTADAQIGYKWQSSRQPFKGLAVALSVQNVFDKTPPAVSSASTILPGVGFDATNASALGRFASLTISKAW